MVIAAAVLLSSYAPATVGQFPPRTAVLQELEAPGAQAFAVVNVRVFDGDGVVPRATVVARGGTIVAVGADLDVPAGVETVDGAGMTLLPGLIDAHTHTPWPGAAESALIFGVTTLLDMFTPADVAARYRDEQRRGLAHERADVFSSSVAVTAPGGHGTQFGVPIPTLAPGDDADAFVADRVSEGADYIKIIYEDGRVYEGLSFETFEPERLRELVSAAHAHGKLAVVHVGYLEGARDALAAGADGLVHGWLDAPADAELAREMARRNVFIVPTLSVLESARGSAGGVLIEDERFAQFLGPEERASLRRTFPPIPGERGSFDHALATVALLREAGVPVLAGTDAPNPGTSHGASMHRELELLVEAGLSPVEALRAATSGPADAFRLPDRGRIAPGLRADLVLVNGDPATDIAATRGVQRVWKAGVEVDRQAFAATVAERLAAAEAPAPTALPPGGLVVSDFDDGRLASALGMWVETTDGIVGGSSSVKLDVAEGGADGTPFALLIRGEIAPGVPFAFSGAMLFPGRQPMAPVDLSGAEGLRFHARGQPGRYRVFLFTTTAGNIPELREFDVDGEWRQVELRWSDFGGSDGSDVRGLAIVGGPAPGQFELWIDQLEFR